MLKGYKIQDGRITEDANGDPVILVITAPDDGARKQLIDRYKIDEHTLSSSLDPDELSRLEFEPDHLAIIFKRPQNYSGADQLMFKTISTGLFLFKDRLIIVMSEPISLFTRKQFNKVGSLNDLMLKVIYEATAHFLEHLKGMNMITSEFEGKIETSLENRYLFQLFSLEKSLVYYLNSITTNGVLIERIKNASAKIGFTQEESEFLDDMVIENNQCLKQAEIHSNIIASLMDARASIVGNNLNSLMKTLNVITIGIMVPTLVVSAFSMNVTIPLQRHPYAFWLIIGLAALSLGGIMLWWYNRKIR